MMKNILVVCSSGLGTSLMIRLHLEAIFRETGFPSKITQTDASSADLYDTDLIIGAKQIVEAIRNHHDVEIVALENITNKQHIKDKILASTLYKDWIISS